MIIAADIGGTNSRFAIQEEGSSHHDFQKLEILQSQKYKSFEDALSDYIQMHQIRGIKVASFAVAGPVIDGVCRVTHLPWVVDSKKIAKEFNIPKVFLLNDVEAVGYSLTILQTADVERLSSGNGKPKGNAALLAPGTGLGEAFLFWDGSAFHPFASEGGHTEFAPLNPIQLKLSEYIMQRFDHPSYETVLSGPGLINIFNFLVEFRKERISSELEEAFKKEDVSKVITRIALEKKSSLCAEAMEIFTTILAQEASNLALKYMAFGGVYLGGGIVPKILPFLKKPSFMEAYYHKGKMSYLLKEMPLFAIDNPMANLLGAFHAAKIKR